MRAMHYVSLVKSPLRWYVGYNLICYLFVVERGTSLGRFYASAQCIVVLSCSSVRPCVRPETLLTRYLAQCLTHFRQT